MDTEMSKVSECTFIVCENELPIVDDAIMRRKLIDIPFRDTNILISEKNEMPDISKPDNAMQRKMIHVPFVSTNISIADTNDSI
jgi:hypothetical protein